MEEQVGSGLERPAAPANKRNMLARDRRERTWIGPVRGEGSRPPHGEEGPDLGAVIENIEQDLVMVAEERDEMTMVLKLDEAIEHLASTRATVDVVAQEDEQILLGRLDRGKQGVERESTTVNITNRDSPRHAGQDLPGPGLASREVIDYVYDGSLDP